MGVSIGSIVDFWSDGKRMHVVARLAFSGNYGTGGDTLDFGAGGVQTSQIPSIVLVEEDEGYTFLYVDGTTDADGLLKVFRGSTASVAASATLTSDTTNTFSDGETITLGGVTYTLKSTLSTSPAVANEIKIAASITATLDNIKSAVNATTGAGTAYGTGTVANPTLSATTKTATTLLFVAAIAGTVGNAIVSTETVAHLSFGGTTFAGGVDATSGSTELSAAAYPTDIAASTPKIYAIFPQLL